MNCKMTEKKIMKEKKSKSNTHTYTIEKCNEEKRELLT